MSYELQDQVWEMVLPSSAKLVLLALAYRADASGSCYPSLAGLSLLTGMDVKTVRKNLRLLEEKGVLVTKQRAGHTPLFTVTPTKNGSTKIGTPTKIGTSQIWEDTPTKIGRTPLPNLVPKQVNNKSYNKSDIYIAEKTDIFAPIGEQVSELQADHVIDLQDQPERILTALEMRSLARVNRINLNCTERLKEVANRQSVTTEIFLECVKEYQKTPRSPGWLVGMLDNVSRDTDKFLTQVRERSRPNAFVQDLIDRGLL